MLITRTCCGCESRLACRDGSGNVKCSDGFLWESERLSAYSVVTEQCKCEFSAIWDYECAVRGL